MPLLTFSTPYPIGATSASVSVTVTAQKSGTVSSVLVLGQGAAGVEFAAAGGDCATTNFTSIGQTCTESVTFKPSYPGLRLGAVVLMGSGNSVLGTAYLSGIGQGGLGTLYPGVIATVAGSGDWKAVQDGPALKAGLYLPTAVALDGAGNLYIADSLHNLIRKVDTSHIISTFAGTGAATYTGDGGPATAATLDTPSGLALDGAGNLFIADTGNNVIREVLHATGVMVTVAGKGTQGNAGDGGPATSANLDQPLGVTVDGAGNLYIADTGNNRIRKVDAASGVITHFAGDPGGASGYSGDNGPANSARLNGPNAVALDASGNMYIPDSRNNVVRMVDSTGVIATFAGGGSSPISNGLTSEAQFDTPSGIAVDPAQNVYITDSQNNAIRKVFANSGYFITIAELGVWPNGFFNGTGYSDGLRGPMGLALDVNGNLYFADSFNNEIREVKSNQIFLDFTDAPTPLDGTSYTQSLYLENDGNAPLAVTSIVPDSNAGIDSTVDTPCISGTSYNPLDSCIIGVRFKPTVVGDPLDAAVSIVTDSINSPFDLQLVGNAVLQSKTSTALSSSLNPSLFSQKVTFTAKVATDGAAGVPTGTITFQADGTIIGSATLDSSGTATLDDSTLTVGSHAIAADYSGNMASSSAVLTQVVQVIPTKTVLGVTSLGGNAVQMMTTVVGSSGPTPTGTVTFVNGATTIGTATLDAGGVGMLSKTLAGGNYSVIANYSGDATHAPSSSPVVSFANATISFTVTSTPSAVTVVTGKSKTVKVDLTSTNAFADTVNLVCGSLPALVSCQFSTNNVVLAGGATVSVQLSIHTNSPLAGGSSAMNTGGAPRGFALAGLFIPTSLLFGWIFWRFRRRAVFPAAVALLAYGALLMSGCNWIDQASAKPGSYVIQIIGVGAKTNAVQSMALPVTITQQ